uniref:helicase HerA domain-containing protein n=1 Tax=Leuconostoc mesenteroides TaxID=1245 RepID=UPI0032DFC587
MKIDDFYTEIDKSNFYLGMVSAVFRENSYVQVENLSLLSQRKLRSDNLIPNTINYLAVVDSVHGLFIGEIYQARVNGSNSVHDSMNSGHKENIFPELGINVIAILQGQKFVLAGVKTVGITDKVYIANQSIIEIYFNSLEINEYPVKNEDGVIQKDSEGKTKYQKKLNDLAEIEDSQNKVLNLAPNTLFDRHLMTVGTTNSGKSTSALSILDKLITAGKKVLIIDPTGEYDSSFKKEQKVLKLVLGKGTFLSLGSVTIQQWSMIVGTNDSTQPAVLADAIKSLRFQFLRGENSAYLKVGKTVQNVESDLA